MEHNRERRGLLSVWDKEKVSGKRTDKLPIEVAMKLYAEAKRLEPNYSDCALSRKLGVPRVTIWEWLNKDTKPSRNIRVIDLHPRESLARFFGCLEVAGYIGKSPSYRSEGSERFCIWIGSQYESKIKIIQRLVERIVGKKYPYYFDKREEDETRKGRYYLTFVNKHLVEFWQGYEGMPNHYGRPEYEETRNKYPKQYLSGVLDVRGGIWYKTYSSLVIGNNSERTIDEVASAMSQVGVSFEKKEYLNNPDFELRVTNKNDLELILDKILIRSKLVRKRLEKAIGEY